MFCSNLTRKQSNTLYEDVLYAEDSGALRRLCKEDLFFLLTIAFKRRDINNSWLYERCREVEKNPDGYLDLWAREHYKSTIITFGKSIQDILINPEETIGIFSHTRPIAKGFLEQIKRELEDNTFLKNLFPDILYQEPKRESPRWSLDNGIIVKRKANPKESTVEAWGLVDGQPTSKHFSILIYDDVVTRESVTTPDQIKKVTEAWELSLNLGARKGRRRHIGTRYHFNDTYKTIISREAAIPRIYPATNDGTMEGKPVFFSKELLAQKRKDMGPYIFSCQMLQNSIADKAMGFKEEWAQFYDILRNYTQWNFYLLVDPANEKKQENDYTVILIIALAPDGNYYLVDGIRDRLNLTERTRKVFEFHRRYRPLKTGYEKYGKDTDIEHIEGEMEKENYRFPIIPLGGNMAKEDRIRKLVPIFEQGKMWLPHKLIFVTIEGQIVDLINVFLQDEYLAFPVSIHDDMLDCMARITDLKLGAKFPDLQEDMKVISMTHNKDNTNKVQTEYALFG